MAMRMPRFLKPDELAPAAHVDSNLRAIGEPAQIIPFPLSHEKSDVSVTASRVPARVQIRTRRLSDNRRPEEDRFEASFVTADASPVELLKSLTAMLDEVAELKRSASMTEPVILDIHLIAG